MKAKLTVAVLLLCVAAQAQIGIATTSPNSTLDVRGSMSHNYRAFSSSTSVTSTDYVVVFTGTSAATATLPDATACTGRFYVIKNASSNSSTVTIATTSSQTIDGLSSWALTQTYKSVMVASNGTNWYVATESLPGSSAGTAWIYGGNNTSAMQNIGTTSNYALPFITNNTEKMRLTTTGNLGIGTSTFDATYPEKLLVDAGSTSSINVISGKGSINNYLQLNIQNRSSGGAASSDVVATADNGNESVNYIDMGINSSNYSNSNILGGANNAYLYSTGNDFVIGNATSGRHLRFFTNGTATTDEKMRILNTGNVGINVTAPTEKLQVEGNIRLSGGNKAIFFDGSVDPYAGIKNISKTGEINELLLFSGNDVSGSYGTDRIRLATHEIHFSTGNSTGSVNSGDPTTFYEDYTNVPTRMYINQNGNVGIGTTTFGSTAEKLLVDAGASGGSSFQNVIVGKGNTNSYAQLNIQNMSSGTAASSDVVATADNGSESVNFIDMGINGGSNTSTGILGGANTAYLYATGGDFAIGNASSGEDLIFFTGGTATGNTRMRISSTSVYPGQDNSYTLGRNGNRWSQVWAANGVIQTSDQRTKRNIHTIPYGLKEVMQMRPVAYNWINDPMNMNKIGLVAQEVKQVVPEVVAGNEKTETLGMNYAELVPVLIKAIQEQQQQIEELKKEIKTLKRK